MLESPRSELLTHLNKENAQKLKEITRLQSELSAFGQSAVMVAVEPETTVFYSEDSEVTVETDVTLQRFRCKQLKAEKDVLAQKEHKFLPNNPEVRFTAFKSDFNQLVSELRSCIVFYQERQRELENDIEREKRTNAELEATVSAAEDKLSEIGQRQESKKEVHKRLEGRCNRLEAANKNKQSQMRKFIEKYYPLPSTEAYKKIANKVEGKSGSRLRPLKELLPLNTIVERLISATLETQNDPYIKIDGTVWPPYVELLLQCDIAQRHPSDSERIKLVPFHL